MGTESSDSKRVVVVGGAGFIGSHVTDALVERDLDVHVIDNLSNGKRENVNADAHLHVVDIRDLSAIGPIIEGARALFHFAALPRVPFSIEHPLESHNVNVNGTLNVLVAARDGNVGRVVYSASSSAYGDPPMLPATEDMQPNPKSPYGLQKLIGEQYCRVFSEVYGLPTVALRYFNVYGSRFNAEGAYALVIGKFLKQRLEGNPMTITGDGEQTRDFTNVRDVVRANLLAMDSDKVGKGEVINIGPGKNYSINQIAQLIGGPVEYVPARLEPRNSLADNRKAKELLGWSPEVTIEEGIAELRKRFGL
ncbi:MAG: NAD-dependent epimerase/dehydratase family protein [Candidatus Gracilibacteria bacterium]